MNRQNRSVVAALFFLALTFSPLAGVTAQQQLQWKFKVGQQLQLAIDQQTESLTQVSDQELKVTVQIAMTENWRVEAVDDDGVATIQRSLAEIKLSMRSGADIEISFDSTQQRTAPGMARELGKALKPVLKQPMTIRVNPQGAVIEVRLSEQLEAELEEVSTLLGDFFSPASIKQQLTTLGRLPPGAVAVGTSWSVATATDSPLGKLSLQRQFTYDGQKQVTDGELSEISIVGKAQLEPVSKPGGRVVELKQHQLSGTIRFDAQAGQLSESEERQTLVMETRYRELKIQSRVSTTTRARVTTVKP